MAEIIRMPRMSDTMEEGNIVGWLVEEGAEIDAGDTIAEVETDKATMDLDSPDDGVLLHIAVKEGAVPIGGVIAIIGEEGEDWKALLASADSASNGSGASEATTEAAEPVATATAAPVAAVSSSDSRVKASPLAKTMAKDAGIDINTVTGSGDNGRVIKRDIEAMMKQAPAAPVAAPQAPASAPAPVAAPASPAVASFNFNAGGDNHTDHPVSQMRKTIARRLGESKFSAPHFYLTVEINMAQAIEWRKKLNAVSPVKISFNDLVLKASAAALREHRVINSSWMGDHIRENGNINIGVAVAVEDGLLVPVIRHADMKSLSQISAEVRELAGKAKTKKLGLDEMQGNTFTISNLGMFGIEEFTAIINPPDACIMAVGGIIDKPIVEEGRIVAGKMMKVTLSCDHRVVDGASGAKFLNSFKETLENPVRLLV